MLSLADLVGLTALGAVALDHPRLRHSRSQTAVDLSAQPCANARDLFVERGVLVERKDSGVRRGADFAQPCRSHAPSPSSRALLVWSRCGLETLLLPQRGRALLRALRRCPARESSRCEFSLQRAGRDALPARPETSKARGLPRASPSEPTQRDGSRPDDRSPVAVTLAFRAVVRTQLHAVTLVAPQRVIELG